MSRLLNPATVGGAVFYAVLFLGIALVASLTIRASVKRLLAHPDHILFDRTGIRLLTQLSQVLVFLCAMVLYAHLVPALHHLATALLAGVSVASVVIGIAAQSTLSNVIAGFTLLLYRPFRVGDRVQLGGPAGLLSGRIESLGLGYTIVRGDDGRKIIVPNSTMATQVTINLNDVSEPKPVS